MKYRRFYRNGGTYFFTVVTNKRQKILTDNAASVGRILVSDKIFNTSVIAIHCGNAQNVGFENPIYKIISSITL